MQRSRIEKLFCIILTLAAVLTAGSCRRSSKISSKDEILANISLTAIAGNEQRVTQKLDVPIAFKFRIVDKLANPVAGADISFCMQDITSADETLVPDAAEAAEKCRTGKMFFHEEAKLQYEADKGITAISVIRPEDIVGLVLEQNATSDQDGVVSIRMAAPARFDSKIAVIASIGPHAAMMYFNTTKFGEASQIVLQTSRGNKELAGTPFDLFLRAVDQFGNAVSTFSDTFDVEIVAEIGDSWARIPSKFPSGKISCAMAGGQCLLPGGPYWIAPSGEFTVKISSVEGIHQIADAVLKNNVGPTASIILTDKLGGPATAANIHGNVVLDQGEKRTFVAAFIDAGGNYLEDSDAVWTITDELLVPSLPKSKQTWFEFVSSKMASGNLVATSGISKSQPVPILVRPGAHDAWEIITAHQQTEIAGECFTVKVNAIDEKKNVVTDVNGIWNMVLNIGGTLKTGPSVLFEAHWDLGGIDVGASTNVSVDFVNGVGNLPVKACLFDATEVNPKLEVSSNFISGAGNTLISGEQTVAVSPGLPTRLILGKQSFGTNGDLACDAATYQDSSLKCIKLKTDGPAMYYVIASDKAGNQIKAANSTWTVTGPLAASLNGVNTTSSGVTLAATTIGSGTITMSSIEGFAGALSYSIGHGVPKLFTVTSEHSNTESVDTAFRVRVDAFDLYNNPCTTFIGVLSMVFQLKDANPSPAPINALPVANMSENLTFVNGLATTVSTVQAKYATLQPGVATPLKPYIELTAPDASKYQSGLLTILAGIATAVKPRSSIDGLGGEITAPISISSNSTLLVNIAAYDQFGNFVRNETASFLVGGVLSPTAPADFVPPAGSALNIVTTGTGSDGIVTINPASAGIPDVVISPITVTSSSATNFKITTTNNQLEPAGQNFNITITARDKDNNTSASYAGAKSLYFTNASAVSWSGVASNLPSGTYTCVFAAGACTLHDGVGTPLNFMVANSLAQHFITVTDLGGAIPDIWAKNVTAIVGAATGIKVADKLGGPAAGAVVSVTAISITADDTLTLAGAYTDAGGNYVSDVSGTTSWSSTDPALNNNLNTNSGALVTLTALQVVSGTYTLLDTPLTGVSPTISISAGVVSKILVETANGNAETAGVPFSIILKVTDADGNPILTYDRTVWTSMILNNYDSGPDIIPDVGATFIMSPDWETRLVTSIYTGHSEVLGFVDGVATVSRSLVMNDASGVLPYLTVHLNVVAGFPALDDNTNTFTVSPGPVKYLAMMAQPSTNQGFYTCYKNGFYLHQSPDAGTDASDWGKVSPVEPVWMTYPICAVMTGGGTEDIYIQAQDRMGNFLANVQGDWEFVPWTCPVPTLTSNKCVSPLQLASLNVGLVNKTNSNVVTINKNLPTYVLNNGNPVPVPALLKFTATAPAAYAGMVSYAPIVIGPKPVTDFTVDNANVMADEPFSVRITLYDVDGAVAGYDPASPTMSNSGDFALDYSSVGNSFSGPSHNVSLAWNGGTPPSSKIGTPPALVGGAVINFNSGVVVRDSVTVLMPYAGSVGLLNVTVAGIGTRTATFTSVSGVPRTFQILTAPTNAGVPISSPLNIDVDAPTQFYASLWDLENNYVGNHSVDWTPTGVVIGNIVGNSSMLFQPILAGTGSLQGSPNPTTVTGGLVTYNLTPITVTPINVVAGVQKGFGVTTEHVSVETAGVDFTIDLRATDKYGNTVTTYTGNKTLFWRLNDMTPNREGLIGKLNGADLLTTTSGTITFVNGIANPAPILTLYNSSIVPVFEISSDPSFATLSGVTPAILVNPGALHHYGVFVSDLAAVYEPRCNSTSTLSALIESRDIYGNPVTTGEASANVTMVKENGTAANGVLGGSLTGLDLSDGIELVTGVSWNAAGRFRLKVTSTGYTTPVTLGSKASTVISADASLNTVCGYVMAPIGSSFRAGEPFVVNIKAIDFNSNIVLGIDSALSGQTYSWSGAANAPSGTAPVLPVSISFSGGQANIPLTLYKAETLGAGNFQISDDFSPVHSGSMLTALTINYNDLMRYVITPSVSTIVADDTGVFDITIANFDLYDNPRPGESGVDLIPEFISGPTGVTQVAGLEGPNSAYVLNLALANSKTITNLFYGVPHTVRFKMQMGAAIPVTSGTVVFTATNRTVNAYTVRHQTSVVAGTPFTVTVRARDTGGNILPMLDTFLNGQSYTWSGAGNSPNGDIPSFSAISFTNGVALVTTTLYRREFLDQADLLFNDNFSPPRGTDVQNSEDIDVLAKPATILDVSPKMPATTDITVGSGFDLIVSAEDIYGNNDPTFTSDTINFSWVNANASVENVSAPTVLSGGVKSFPGGVFDTSDQTANAFKLYNSFDTGIQLSVTSSLPTATVDFTAVPEVYNHIKIRAGSTHASALIAEPLNISADVPVYPLHSHGYDVFGNWRGLRAVQWQGLGSMSCGGCITSGSDVVTSTALSPSPAGAGTINLIAGGTLKTMTVNVAAGAAQRYAIIITGSPTAVTAGVGMSVSVQALDAKGNIDVNYTGPHNVSWIYAGAANSPAPAAVAPLKPAAGNQTFAAGLLTLAGFTVYNAADAFSIQIIGDLLAATTAVTQVDPAAANRYRITTGSTTPLAGAAFPVTITAYDPFDNIDENYVAGPSLTFSWSNTTPSKVGALAGMVEGAGAKTFVAGVYGSSSTFKLHNKHDVGVALSTTVPGGITLVAPLAFTPAAATAIASIKVKTDTANDTLYDAAVDTTSINTDQSRSFYVHAYDTYGNWHSKPTASWTGITNVAGNLAPVSGTSTVFNPVAVGSGSVRADYLTFNDTSTSMTITNGAVNSFGMTYNGITAPTINAGDQFGVTVTAYDQDANIVTSPASQAINLLWTLNNTTTGPAPDLKDPVIMTNGNQTFISGVYTTTGTAFRLFNVLNTNVSVGVAKSGSPAIAGTSPTITTIVAGSPTKWYATTGSTTVVADVPFAVTVKAQDTHGNTAVSFVGSRSLTFSWLNTTAAVVGGDTALTDSGTLTFAAGEVTTGSTFRLYKRTGTNYDAGSVGVQVTGEALTSFTLGSFTVNPGAATFNKVIDTNATNTLPSNELGTYAMAADQTRTLYNHVYDQYGNWVSLLAANWTSDGDLTGRIGASVTGVTNVTVDPVLIGTGTVTATVASPSTVDATGVITVNPGTESTFDVVNTVTTAVMAGTAFGATITAKDNDGNVATGFTGAKSITWSGVNATTAPNGKVVDLPVASQTFGAGVLTIGNVVAFYNATNSIAALRAQIGGVLGTSATLDVTPSTATNLNVPAITSKVSDAAFSPTSTLRDAWNNPSTVGCTTPTVTVSCASAGTCDSPGLRGTTVGGVVSTNASDAFNGAAVATSVGVKLRKAGSNTIRFTTDCAAIFADTAVTVTPSATVQTVYMSQTNAVPADGAHATSVACTPGTSIACPTLYSFAWDAYGNEIGAGNWSCPAYTYVSNDGSPFNVGPYNNATKSFASGHSTTITHNLHVNGYVRCTAGAATADTTHTLTQISKSFTWSCGNWACSAGSSVGTCTVTNSSKYDFDSVSYGGVGAGNTLSSNCNGALAGVASSGACSVTVTGTPGSNSGFITPTATVAAAQASRASITSPTGTLVQSGVNAPNCSNNFAINSGGWSCNGSDAEITVTLTNNNTVNNSSFGTPGYIFANNAAGAAQIGTTCDSATVLKNGGSCAVTYRVTSGYTVSNTFEIQAQPTDGYFQNQNFTSPGLISCP